MNPSVSNGKWTVKQAGIREHSLLMLNKPFDQIPTWDEAGIAKRSEELFSTAQATWKRP